MLGYVQRTVFTNWVEVLDPVDDLAFLIRLPEILEQRHFLTPPAAGLVLLDERRHSLQTGPRGDDRRDAASVDALRKQASIREV